MPDSIVSCHRVLSILSAKCRQNPSRSSRQFRGIAALFWLVAITEIWMFYLFAIMLGFGNGGGGMLESPFAAELFGMKSHGSIFGVLSFAFTIGAAVGPFLAGYIFDVTGTYQSAFLITAAVGIVGIILAATLRQIRRLDVKI